MTSRSWHDARQTGTKTDFIYPDKRRTVMIGGLESGFVRVDGQLSVQTPEYLHDSGTSVSISASEIGGLARVTTNTSLPTDFELRLPSMIQVASYLESTAGGEITPEVGDSFEIEIANESTVAGHVSVLFTTLNTLIPSTVTKPGAFLPGSIAKVCYRVESVSPLSNAAASILVDLGVTKDYADSLVTGGTISHTSLSNIGVNPHTTLDNHLSATTIDPHAGQDLRTSASPQFSSVVVSTTTPSSGSVLTSRDYVTSVVVTSHTGLSNTGVLPHTTIDASLGSAPQQLYSTATPTFARVMVNGSIVDGWQLATKGYVDTMMTGFDFQPSVLLFFDNTAALPVGPSVGDRYIAQVTAHGWTANYIYEWSGSAWTEYAPHSGTMLYVNGGTIFPGNTIIYTGSSWTKISVTLDHNDLLNKGVLPHTTIDASLGTAPQQLYSTASPTFSNISISGTAHVYSTTEATSSTGAAMIDGGLEIAKGLYVTGSETVAGNLGVTGAITATGSIGSTGLLHVYNTAEATSSTGAAMIDGGLEIAKGLYVTGSETVAGNLGVTGAITATGSIGSTGLLRAYNTAEATSSTGGAMMNGGLQIAKGLYVGGSQSIAGSVGATGIMHLYNTFDGSVSTTNGALILDGGVNMAKGLYVGSFASVVGQFFCSSGGYFYGITSFDTTPASVSAGSIKVWGGIQVMNGMYCSGSSTVYGDLSCTGTFKVGTNPTAHATITGGLTVGNSLYVTGNETISGGMSAGGDISCTGVFIGYNTVEADASVGSMNIYGGGRIAKGLYVGGSQTLSGSITVGNNLICNGTANIQGSGSGTYVGASLAVPNGDIYAGRNLWVANSISAMGNIYAHAPLFSDSYVSVLGQLIGANTADAAGTSGAASLMIYGGAAIVKSAYIGGQLTVNGSIGSTGMLEVFQTSEATSTTGGGVFDGGVLIKKGLYVTGNETVAGSLGVSSGLGVTGTIGSTGLMRAYNTAEATSSTGGFMLDGGAQIAKGLYVTGSETVAGSVGITGSIGSTGLMRAYNTVEATSSTGGFMADGGVRIAKGLYVTGSESVAGSVGVTGSIGSTGLLHVYNTAEATSSTGAAMFDGGLQVAKGLYLTGSETIASNLYVTGSISATGIFVAGTHATISGTLWVGDHISITNNASVHGGVYADGTIYANSTAEADTSLGSLVVAGGARTAKGLYVAGSQTLVGSLEASGVMHIYNTTEATSTTAAAMIDGGMKIAKGIYVGGAQTVAGSIGSTGIMHVYNTTDSTSSDGGAVFDGGIMVQKSLYVNDGLYLSKSTGGTVFDFYATTTLSGTWSQFATATNGNQTVTLARIGAMCFCTVNKILPGGNLATSLSTTYLTYSVTIPTLYRQSTTVQIEGIFPWISGGSTAKRGRFLITTGAQLRFYDTSTTGNVLDGLALVAGSQVNFGHWQLTWAY